MNFEDFTTIDFTLRSGPGFVYILCWVAEEREIPFYVGETQSLWGRLNDYYWADFQASTDFKVGEAVKHLYARNRRVIAKYKPSTDRRQEQNAIIAALHAEGRKLLNDCRGYKYKTADAKKERAKIQEFVDALLRDNETTHPKISN
jgi:hypothetical protein